MLVLPGAARRRTLTALALVGLAGVAAAIHAGAPAATDPDALYHLRHAWLYRARGLFLAEFPWARFSAIQREASDLWYGFHVLLVPFTLLRELSDALEPAGISITFACLALVWTALRRLRIRWALFWTLVFAFATGDSLFRLAMVRPHPVSLGLALLLFAFACEERPPRAAVLAASAALAWVHVSLFWVPVLLGLAVALARGIARRRLPLAWAAWTAMGFAAGTLARPNPIGGLRLAAIQIVTWLGGRGGDVPLEVGRELRPFGWVHFQNQLVALSVLVAAALALHLLDLRRAREVRERAVEVASSLLLLAIFAAMTFAVARRANDFLVAFAVVFAGLVAGSAVSKLRERSSPVRAVLLLAMAGSIVAMPVRSAGWLRGYRSTLPPVDRLREAAAWLTEHAAEGDVVFHAHWDQFASLFFWNQLCRYVNGNDPVFLYAFDPSLYAIVQQLQGDRLILKDGRGSVIDQGRPRELHSALTERFQARWILVQKARTPGLAAFLLRTPRFQLVFETSGEAVFRLLP